MDYRNFDLEHVLEARFHLLDKILIYLTKNINLILVTLNHGFRFTICIQ
jgi:hypothetical protein